MSLQVTNVKRRRLNEMSCLFCDETGNLVEKPKPQSFVNIQRAADRRKDDIKAFEKLIDEIKHQLTSHSFEVSLLAKRLAELTEIEDAVVENRVMKSLLIDKYGGNVLFSYSSDRSKSSLVFMGNIPLDEVIEHIRTINSTNYIVQVAKQLRKEILRTEVIPDGYLCDEILIEQFLKKEVVHDMKRGMLSVKRTEGKFNAVRPDLALEQSQNRSSAVTGGLIGITKNEEAMQRWLLLYPFKNSIHEAFSSYLGIQADSTSDINYHNEWTQSRINKDEKDIQNIKKYFNACNPYNDDDNCALRNIYTDALNKIYEDNFQRPPTKAEAKGLLNEFNSLETAIMTTHISSLPIEIIFLILKWLVSNDLDLKSLETFSAVCRGFYLCARDPEIWRLACLRVWGLNCDNSPGKYLSWRNMFIERARVQFNGCYISKTTYIRHGENSFQDTFYRPWYMVTYFRYLR
ncbi:unnamed protein product [Brassicogethes aeneus]|uniref:F-box only protein 9 n=1 Tax=Brassicogethes aeneus TaxID=1431903 RepID=A0A9P0B0J8_BRAAE|nr:unnamed protein product [Brassicogethes aeneus]